MLRQPDLWVYANVESGEVPFDSAESTFNRLSMSERSKLDAEVTTNVAGQRGAASAAACPVMPMPPVNTSWSMRWSPQQPGPNCAEPTPVRPCGKPCASLIHLLSELMALEVIWQPEGRGDVLSAEELDHGLSQPPAPRFLQNLLQLNRHPTSGSAENSYLV